MSTIITRSTGANPKGAPLTAGELDQNFINLNTDKVEATRAVNTTAGDLTGGGDLSGDRTLGLASTGITAGTVNNSTTQLTPLTLDVKGRVTGVGTPQTIAPSFANVTSKPTTLSGYGITDGQPTITGAATTIDTEDLTASRALASDSSGKVAVSSVTATELGYLSGVTSAVQTQLGGKQATSEKNQANGYAGLDSSGKLSDAVLPDLAISEYLGEVANETAMLALTGQEGDWCTRSDVGTIYIITGNSASTGGWMQLSYPGTPVKSVAGKTGVVTLVKGDVGLGNVDNTSDADKNSATVTLTNKTISGSSNTLSNIGNSSLTNSAITFGATSQALGSTVSALNAVSIGGTTAAAGAFTTLSASSTVSGTGFSNYLASPPAIGGSSPAAGNFTNLGYTGTLTGGTGVIAIGTNQIYKDASGNVGIGTSAPANKFEVYGNSAINAARASTTAGFALIQAQAVDYWSGPTFTGTSIGQYGSTASGTTAGLSNAGLGVLSFQNTSAGLIFTNGGAPIIFGITSTERVRIASTGVVTVGNPSSPAISLDPTTANSLVVNSSGNVGIGTSSSAAKLSVQKNQDALTYFDISNETNGSSAGVIQRFITYLSSGTGTTSADIVKYKTGPWYFANNDGPIQMRGKTNGVELLSGATVWTTLSDETEKSIIEPIESALSKVDTLRSVIGRYNTDSPDVRRPFLIAQDVEKVFPEATPRMTDGKLGLDYSGTIPLLVAAIKELSAKVTILEAKVN